MRYHFTPVGMAIIKKFTAGVQPWWIQGIRRGDGVGVLRKNYLIRKEKLGKNVVDKKIEERKRLIFLGLHKKPIKLWDKKFALFTEATGILPVSRGSEDTERLPIQVLETQADKWMQGASMLQGIILKKRGRGREWLTQGDQAASVSEAP